MASWVVGCGRQPAPDANAGATDSNTVAVVGEAVITADALRAQLQQRFPEPRTRELSLEQKQTVLESLLRAEALYARARATGFEQSPEMQAQIKNLVVARFLENQMPATSVEVPDETVDAWYRANQERFAQPAAAHGAILFIAVPVNASADKRTEARRHAEALWNEARHPAAETDFSKLVARFSDDQSSRYRGGDIGWQSAGSTSVHPAVRDALLALEGEAEVAPLVETERGFYIVKLLERRAARQQPLAQVQKVIRREVSRESARQAEREFYDRMKQGVNIRINQELLESITLPVQPATPPKLPGLRRTRSDPTDAPDAPLGQPDSGVANVRLRSAGSDVTDARHQ
jgi:parvulin-like peptidyl-prolyl isomerase